MLEQLLLPIGGGDGFDGEITAIVDRCFFLFEVESEKTVRQTWFSGKSV